VASVKRPRKPVPYAVGFASTGVVLAAMTLILVLVVLPRRFVLHAGLRESGINFPAFAAPFAPPDELHWFFVPPPLAPDTAVRSPSDLFWEEIQGYLDAMRLEAAIPRFQAYLELHGDDRSVRREYALTLDRAGRSPEAVTVFRGLLEEEDDPELRLLLARSLRDQGRLNEALLHYEHLADRTPDDPSLALERARALAWAARYPESAAILEAYLAAEPDEPEIRLELARILFWSGRVEDAEAVIALVPEESIVALSAEALRDDITAANTPPPPVPVEVVELSLFEQALREAANERYATAAELLRRALEERPDDPQVMLAYADILQFQLGELETVREVLTALEEVQEPTPTLRMRLVELAVWTGRNEEAAVRLEALLRDLQARPARVPTDSTFTDADLAAALALRGDLYRWEGQRTQAGALYERALAVDPTLESALSGFAALEVEIDELVHREEVPRLGTAVYSFSDSDDFTRLDLGLEGVVLDGWWVWTARSGLRWLRGVDPLGGSATERGLFAELEAARWWRWGTLKTGLRLGIEEVRPDGTDLSLGAFAHWSNLGGFRTDLRFDHGPAYPLTVTLQSALARVERERLAFALARQLAGDWSLSLSGDASWLRMPESEGAGSTRLEMGAAVLRDLGGGLTMGFNARALAYTESAPILGGRRLFWDPESVLSSGAYALWTSQREGPWQIRALVNPSLALIRERALSGADGVPHLAAEAGLARVDSRIRATLDAFYYQGRFEGYRAYGVRLGISMTDRAGRGGGR
jgi:tetratricopeptide (TPR) repeat protein